MTPEGPARNVRLRTPRAAPTETTTLSFDALYGELHRLARRQLARSGRPGTLSPTTLLHEAYLQMAGRDGSFPDEARFLGYAARVMRGLIIDYARNRGAEKRGGAFHLAPLGTEVADRVPNHRELRDISDALDELAKEEPALAEIVDLKFFCGFSFAEIAAMHRASERTIQRRWEKARLYLHHALGGDPLH